VLVTKLFHPANTADLLICSYAGIPRSALDMSHHISLASKYIGRSSLTFVICPIRFDSLSPKAQGLLNISARFGGSTSPVAYRERRSRSIAGFNDNRKAFVVHFQVVGEIGAVAKVLCNVVAELRPPCRVRSEQFRQHETVEEVIYLT
jgi:hypothetical protein